MKIDLSQHFENDDGTPSTEPDPKGGPPVTTTLRKALIRICLADIDGDLNPVKGEAKVRRFELYSKIKSQKGDIVELTPEEVADLRQWCLIFPTLAVGQIRAMLA